LSTGGSAKMLRDAGLPVTEVSDYTGFPEMLDGRVKTLHPKIHGGILARRDAPEHLAAIDKAGIPPIDLVVVNLYPFRQTVAKTGLYPGGAIENIDIGGPTMVRAAAKNHAGVAVVTDPADYAKIIEELRAGGGQLSATPASRWRRAPSPTPPLRRRDRKLPDQPGCGQPARRVPRPPATRLRQAAADALRRESAPAGGVLSRADAAAGAVSSYRQLQGKELSYNNIGDADAAWECVKSFDSTACVIVSTPIPAAWRSARRPWKPTASLRHRSDLGVRRHHRLQLRAR